MLFHLDQHLHQGHLHLVKELLHVCFFKLLLQGHFQTEGDIGILAGVDSHLGDIDIIHGFLIFAPGADQFLDRDHVVIEIFLGQGIEIVLAGTGGDQVGGNQGIELDPGDLNPVLIEHQGVKLNILPAFLDPGILQYRLESLDHRFAFQPLAIQRHIISLTGFPGKGNTDHLAAEGIQSGGLGIEHDKVLFLELGCQRT